MPLSVFQRVNNQCVSEAEPGRWWKTKGTRGKFQKESEGGTRLECPQQLGPNIPLIKRHSPPFLQLFSGATTQMGGAVPCREATMFPFFPWTLFDFISDFSASQTVICCSLQEERADDLSDLSHARFPLWFHFLVYKIKDFSQWPSRFISALRSDDPLPDRVAAQWPKGVNSCCRVFLTLHQPRWGRTEGDEKARPPIICLSSVFLIFFLRKVTAPISPLINGCTYSCANELDLLKESSLQWKWAPCWGCKYSLRLTAPRIGKDLKKTKAGK